MLENFFDKILEEDETKIGRESGRVKEQEGEKEKFNWRDLLLPAGIFLLALIPRLYLLFFAGDPQSPGWYNDTFHHWQVAYLTKTVGFKHGFLRLWDFKGMEYFWGLLHPLVLIILFALTGSVDILVPRFLSVFCGALAILFLFLLIRRHFSFASALGAAIFTSFMPVVLYSDTVGMQEPLGLVLIFGGLLLWPKRPAWAGFLLALAGMVRAEYWLFGVGLFGTALFSKEKFDQKVLFSLGWTLPTIFYMKYLLDQTGNPIYPIYWNFLASVKGEWFTDVPLPPGTLQAQFISRIVFVFGILAGLLTLFKRPRFYLLFLFGFANVVFLGFMLGFSAYIRGYLPRFWIDRLFAWPYAFIGILLSVVFLFWLPARFRFFGKLKLGWLVLIGGLLISQIAWNPIEKNAKIGIERFEKERELAEEVASVYQGGTILIPEDRPPFVYALVNNHGIKGDNLLGQMYDPFFYFKEEDPFLNWSNYRQEVFNWLRQYNVRLLVVYQDRERYQKLIKKEPEAFHLVKKTKMGIQIYEVKPD